VAFVIDDQEIRQDLSKAAGVRFEDVSPVRRFPSYAGQRNYPGLYYAAKMDRHVAFESWLVGGERPLAATASVMALEDVPAGAAAAARDWERHIVEVETGLPPGAPSGASPKAEYDPATTTLRQRQPRPRPASAEARARPARSQLQLQDRYNYRVRQDTCGNLPCHYPKGYHHAPSAYYWQSACLRSHGNRQPGHSLMAAATRPNVPGAGLQGRSRGPACYSPRAEPLLLPSTRSPAAA
jgi:hypothetical protein